MKVSVIIPIYNSEEYLSKCIESVLSQTYKNYELILINDGSTDGSKSICDDYANHYNQIKVFHRSNKGVSAARNFGIDVATGEYLCFVDSDDYIESIMLEELIKESQQGLCDLIISGIYFKRNDGKSWNNIIGEFQMEGKKMIKDKLPLLFNSYLLYNPVGKLYKASIIKDNNLKFTENVSFGEDPIFNCNFIKLVEQVKVVNKSYYNYVKHGGTSLSNRFNVEKYNNNKEMHESIYKLFSYYNIVNEEFISELKWRYSKELTDMIFSITRAENISNKTKTEFLKKIFRDKEYIFLNDYLEDVNGILLYLIKNKKSSLVVAYFNLRKLLLGG